MFHPRRPPATQWRVTLALAAVLVTTTPAALAKCAVGLVVAKGHVEHAPDNAKVLVQLFFAHMRKGESGEASLKGSEFAIPVKFFTLSHGGILGEFLERCERKLKSVIVTLVSNDRSQEFDRLTLKLLTDFNEIESLNYASKAEIVLKGPK